LHLLLLLLLLLKLFCGRNRAAVLLVVTCGYSHCSTCYVLRDELACLAYHGCSPFFVSFTLALHASALLLQVLRALVPCSCAVSALLLVLHHKQQGKDCCRPLLQG
jgi:hypothetical protein